MKIGIIGTGSIATAVVRGIAKDGHEIVVSERNAENAASLSAAYDNVSIMTNQGVIDASEVIILGLLPSPARYALPTLAFRPDQTVLSLIADIPLAEVAQLVAPAKAAATVLPFPGIANGASPVMAMGEMALVQQIFGRSNPVYEMRNTKELDAFICAQAVLSVVARVTDDAAKWLGDRIDNPAEGEKFLRDLIASSLSHSTAADLISALNTDGGYNQRLRLHAERQGISGIVTTGLDALSD